MNDAILRHNARYSFDINARPSLRRHIGKSPQYNENERGKESMRHEAMLSQPFYIGLVI